MDKDVKMCSLLEPLQKGWKPKVGDSISFNQSISIIHYIAYDEGNFICLFMYYNGEEYVQRFKNSKILIFLPNTDQLIAMLEKHNKKHKYVYWNLENPIEATHYKWRIVFRSSGKNHSHQGKTHKIALLKLVAFELYGLTWDDKGERWE